MLARVHRDADAVPEVDGFASSHGDHAIDWDPGGLHDADRLVGPYEPGPCVAHDPLGAPQMIEVGVPDDDPVARVDRVGGEPGAGGAGDAIDVGVEEDRRAANPETEGGTAVPVEGRHAAPFRSTSRSRVSMTGVGFVSRAAARSSAA